MLGPKGNVEVELKSISCASTFSLILRMNGQLLVTGKANFLAHDPDDYKVSSIPQHVNLDIQVDQVAAGGEHYMMADRTGILWMSGENRNGCLGFSDSKHRILPQ